MKITELSKSKYEYLVIGAGSGGLTMIKGLKLLGKDCILISKNIGGDCTHFGCVPSKTFLNLADKYFEVKDETIKASIFQSINNKIKDFEIIENLDLSEIEYIIGEAKFISKNVIEVRTNKGIKKIEFSKNAILSTGSSPKTLEIKGLSVNKLLTNESFFELKSLPGSITIIGAGPIGVELATGLGKFGVSVNLISRGKILSDEPLEHSELIKESLSKLGVQVFEDTRINEIVGDKIEIVSNSGSKVLINSTEYYLSAVGRIPNVSSLGLNTAGVVYSEAGIKVNPFFQTSNTKILAIGDCIEGENYTHLANAQARYLIEKIIIPTPFGSDFTTPRVVFSDPKIASVGKINEKSAFIRKFKIDFSTSDRTEIDNTAGSKLSVFVHMLTGRIRGVSMVGNSSEYLINFFTLVISKKITIWNLRNFIPPYPTEFSNLTNLFDKFFVKFKSEYRTYFKIIYSKNNLQINAILIWLFTFLLVNILLRVNSIGYSEFWFEIIPRFLNSPVGALFFFILFTLRTYLLVPASVITVLGAYYYGFWVGLLLNVISSNFSNVFNYYLARYFTKKYNFNNSLISYYLSSDNIFSVIVIRLMFLPYDLISVLAGTLKVDLRKFALSSAIGSLPGTILLTYIGSRMYQNELNVLNILQLVLAIQGWILIIILIGVVTIYFKKYSNKILQFSKK
jgi:pyruvate/2-oxoglutarate dehydrogenase complex dihydrolipoamide dehydrogenase (E3) component/uncharacterized membrane protein YdjX (TVP38/TMEM64 family)